MLANDIRLYTAYEVKNFARHPTLPNDGEVTNLIRAAKLLGIFFDHAIADPAFQTRLADDLVNGYGEILDIQTKIWQSLPNMAMAETALGTKPIQSCPKERSYGDIVLPKEDIAKFVSQEAYRFEKLGLGELAACYVVVLRDAGDVDEGKNLLYVVLQLVVTLQPIGAKPFVVSQRELRGPRSCFSDQGNIYTGSGTGGITNTDLIQKIWLAVLIRRAEAQRAF